MAEIADSRSTDIMSPAERSARMARIRARDTRPELLVRSLLYRLGYRYRLHPTDLPGRPDIAFRGKRKVVFVHGCFWHSHEGCRRNRPPKSNSDYWGPKLDKNKRRDLSNIRELRRSKWQILVVWECETKNTDELLPRLLSFLSDP